VRPEWIVGAGTVAVALSLTLIWSVVRVEPVEPAGPEPVPALDSPAAEIGEIEIGPESAEEPLRLVPDEPDPAYDWLRDRSLELVSEYLGSAPDESPLARWHEASTHEARLLFVSPDRSRVITLAAARADCAEVDRFLREARDSLVGAPGLCDRWVSTAREVARKHGMRGSPRGLLRGVDTSVRVALVYAGWKRTGRNFRLVESRGVGVYPQSEFSVARRLALDGVMRDLGVGPYTDTPIQLVTALLRW
jgi:hypothetical protein